MILEALKNQLLGGCRIRISSKYSADFLNIAMEKHIPYGKMKWQKCEDREYILLSLQKSSAKRLFTAFDERKIEYERQYYGFPAFIMKHRKRYGVFLGLILAAAIINLSGRIIWDIRISGNSLLSERQIEEELKENGLFVGAPIKKVKDVDVITNNILLNSEKIAWMSINYSGTVANIEIVEKKQRENKSKGLYNLVASRNGIIERFEVLHGKNAAQVGDNVKAGDLIVSGIVENKNGKFITRQAEGKVYAVTRRVYNIEIPFEYEKKTEKKSICTERKIVFFSKEISILKNDEDFYEDSAKIYKENYFSPMGLAPLPIGIKEEISLLYTLSREKRSVAEASQIAFYELNMKIEADIRDGDIIEKNIKTETKENSLCLMCEIVCSENIAEKKEYSFENNESEN